MTLTIEQYNYISKKIREDFDTPCEVYDYDKYEKLIALAESFGMTELAEQMRGDLIKEIKI